MPRDARRCGRSARLVLYGSAMTNTKPVTVHPFAANPLTPDQLEFVTSALKLLLTAPPVGDLRRAEASGIAAPDRTFVQSQAEQAQDRLAEWVSAHPGSTCAEAGKALSMTKSAVHHHANELETPTVKGRAKRLVTTYEVVNGKRQRVLFGVAHALFDRQR